MHHFGVLVPSTNTIVEIEYGRLLPPTLQVHIARIPLLSRGRDDTDVDYQARLLGSAKVEVVALAQTGATLSADDYDEQITKRMSEAAGVPAVTSARAIGLAVRALGARRIALVSPFPIPVLERAKSHYTDNYGLEVVALESFSGADSIIYPTLGPDEARDAIARTDRPEIEVFVVPLAIFQQCRSYLDGSAQLASPSSAPIRPRSGRCFRSCASLRSSPAWDGCWKRCPRCEAARHRAGAVM